jgi:mannose-6-phosphate isomerase class I
MESQSRVKKQVGDFIKNINHENMADIAASVINMAQYKDDLKAAASHIADVGRLLCILQSPNEGSSGNVRAVYAQPITIKTGEAVEVDAAK